MKTHRLPKEKPILIKLDEEEKAMLQDLAYRTGTTMAQWVRQVIRTEFQHARAAPASGRKSPCEVPSM